MTNKSIDLFKEIVPCVDKGFKDLWDAADDDGKKDIKNDLYRLNRIISNVKTTNREHQEHYVTAVNELFNKHWFILQKHPKLLWLLLCLCSWDNNKTFFHEWIPLGKKQGNKRIKLLSEVYPNMKNDELELLAEINSVKDLKEMAREIGWSEKELKDL